MRDDELRRLERLVRESLDDPAAWARYVRALDVAGERDPTEFEGPSGRVTRVRACLREAEHELPWAALIEEGDEVSVEERDAPKILGRWRGRVLGLTFRSEPRALTSSSHTFRVRPLGLDDDPPEVAWRLAPRPEWLSRGLVVAPPEDLIELVARAPLPSTPPPPPQ